MIGSFSLKKSALPWGLLFAGGSLALFAYIENHYPGAFKRFHAPLPNAWQVFYAYTCLTSCVAAILSQMWTNEEPPFLAMVSDGFRLAFVFCAPILLMATIFRGLFFEIGSAGASDTARAMGTTVLHGFLFTFFFHLSRKVFLGIARASGRNSFLIFCLALFLLGLSAYRVHIFIDGAKAEHERSIGKGPSIPPLARTPISDVFEGFNIAPDIGIEDGKGGFLFGGRFISYAGHVIGPLVRLDGTGKLVDDFASALGESFLTALACGPKGEIYGVRRVGFAENATLFKIGSNGILDVDFTAEVADIRLSIQGGRLDVFPDGRLLYMSASKLSGEEKILCLSPNGKIDKQFQFNWQEWLYPKGRAGRVILVTMLNSGKIMVLTKDGFYRINQDGTLDNTFLSKQGNIFHSFLVSQDEKFIAELTFLGSPSVHDIRVTITSIDGVTINDWLWAKQGGCLPLNAMAMGRNGFLYGACPNAQSPLTRLTLSGATDMGFLPNTDPNAAIVGTINFVIPLSNGGSFLAGDVRAGEVKAGGRVGHLIRLLEDGNIDPSFWPS